MQVNTQSEDAFFREVEEEIRYDKLKSLWHRFGFWFLCSLVVSLSLTAGFFAYEYWRKEHVFQVSQDFLLSLDEAEKGKQKEALEGLKKITQENTGIYQALAQLESASLLEEQNNHKEALALFDKVSEDSSVEKIFRDIARLRAALLLVNSGSYDEIMKRLKALPSEKNLIYILTQEALALSAWKEKKMQESYKLFQEIVSNEAASGNVRKRSQMMIEVLCNSTAALACDRI